MIDQMEVWCKYCGKMLDAELFPEYALEECDVCLEIKKLIIYTMKADSSIVVQVPADDVMEILQAIGVEYDTTVSNVITMLQDSSEHNPIAINDEIYWMVSE